MREGHVEKISRGEGWSRVGHDLGVKSDSEDMLLPCAEDVNNVLIAAGYGMSSYGVIVNSLSAGRGELRSATMSGDECIDKSESQRSFGSSKGAKVTNEGNGCPEKSNSSSAGSKP